MVINSAAEQNFVYSMVQGNTDPSLGTASDGGGAIYVWLGGNDSSREGTWVWVNGDPFTYTNWGRREPDNFNNNQDGLALGLENWPFGSSSASAYGLAGQWNDISRSNRLTFIVELPLQSNEEDTDDQGEDSGAGDISGDGGQTGGAGLNESGDFSLPYDFAFNRTDGVCGIDDSGLRCWNVRSYIGNNIPNLVNPSQVILESFSACALDENGVSCWGASSLERPPDLVNPSFLAGGFNDSEYCALDDSGIVCWGDDSHDRRTPPTLTNPREIAFSSRQACALDDSGIVCWGDDSFGGSVLTEIPEVVNPSNLTMGDFHACVIDNGTVVCWGSNGFTPRGRSNKPTLVNPREICAGGYHVCALDDDGVKCWGYSSKGQLDVPPLSNPSALFAGRDSTCALDDSGLVCWGEEDDFEAIPSNLALTGAGQRVVSQFLQTASSSQNFSTLNVVNTSTKTQTFRGTLRSSSGERVGEDRPIIGTDVPPMGRLSLNSADLERIFGIEPWSGPAMLTVLGNSTFDLMSKLESPSGLVSNTNCVRENRVLNLEGFDSNNLSYVRLINVGSKPTNAIKGTLFDQSGNIVGEAGAELVAKLDPYQQTWISRDKLASLIGAEWEGEGMLELSPTSGLKVLNLNYITDEKTFFNFSCVETASQVGRSERSSRDAANIGRVFLQTTSSSSNLSLTHLVNTSGEAQSYTGTLYASDGSQVGAASHCLHSGTIPSKGRVVISSEDIESAFSIPSWSGPAILEVRGEGLFELMTKLESPSGLISNTNCVRQNQIHNIGGFDQTDVTYVRFINIGEYTHYEYQRITLRQLRQYNRLN